MNHITYDQLPLKMLSQLSQLYTQPHRHYHNLNHINRCVAMVETIKFDEHYHRNRLKRNQLMVSIWFHDVIYNPYSQNNEKHSAELALESFKDTHFPLDGVRGLHIVEDSILATAHHTKDQDINEIVTKYMLDIDLMGLADPYEQYTDAGNNIRKEYAHLSEAEFRQGRYEFLLKMLRRKRIFYTDEFHNEFEMNARVNIKRELNISYGVI